MASVDVVSLVSTLLDSEKYKEALRIPTEEKFASSFKDNAWELISISVGKIQDDTLVLKPSLYFTCEKLLEIAINNAVPEEALLEFIEQIETAKNNNQFNIILGPLQRVLKKLTMKRGRSLEWCLNAICTYMDKFPTPEYNLEGKERLLMDCDDGTRKITYAYFLLPPFYTPLIEELNESQNPNDLTRQIIVAFLVSLLGTPFVYINLDMQPDSNATQVNSTFKSSITKITQDVCKLERNICKFFPYLINLKKESSKSNQEVKESDLEEKSPYEYREKINMTTLSGLFYCVFSGHSDIPEYAIPQVYSIEYLVNTVMLSVIHFLGFSEYGPLTKAMSLCKALLDRCPNNFSHVQLLSPVYFDLCKSLVNITVYCNYTSLRKEAVNLITSEVNKFEYKGRCMLIKYIIDVSNHSGIIGYAITLYKNSIDASFKEKEVDDCFIGAKLFNMLKKICHLPYGAESDLMELADQIISSLNFLRYLVLKDTNNVTKIREHFPYIENEYLDKLRTGLNMSKAHYQVKLKDLKEGNEGASSVVTVNVGGNDLDNIPIENKKEIINSALNAFHLMKGLVARLSECFQMSSESSSVNLLKTGRKIVLPLASVPVKSNQSSIRYYCQSKVESKLSAVPTEQEERQYEENVKNRILDRALDFVQKTGWSVESLSAGAEALGYPSIAHGMFPNGGGDLVHYFNVKCNNELVEQMKTWSKEELKDAKVPAKFIEDAIVTRLFMIEPYKSTWPKAMAIQTLPSNVPNCLATLLSLVDDICYYSGDRSVDFNWYMRRVGLAGIYKASELFYLTDKSTDNTATKNFVVGRIRDAILVQSALNLNPISAAPQTLTAAFTTAKNILGMNTVK